MSKLTNNDLINAGIPGGSYFPKLLKMGNDMILSHSRDYILSFLKEEYSNNYKKKYIPLCDNGPEVKINIEADNEIEQNNLDACIASMKELSRTPTVRASSIMPDACPSGSIGNITVGGVVATENAIHPGMHSADICCSMMATNLGKVDPHIVMDNAFNSVKFGPYAKNSRTFYFPDELKRRFTNNSFMSHQKIMYKGDEQLGTQGDGNHFYFVGVSEKTGDTYIVSHHGSRGVGATLYTLGMKIAEKFTKDISPETMKANSWIEANSQIGQDYWEALQITRDWTKLNHSLVHDMIAQKSGVMPYDRFWNEHNFVFKRNGLYYHAKGATPAWKDFSEDADHYGRTIIPLNMSQPILIVNGCDNSEALGFSPHGAGRNMSRKAHKKIFEKRSIEDVFAEETKHIDARFQAGKVDISELPSAYKNAESVAEQIERLRLAKVIDRIIPHGSIMAGDIEPNWKKKRKKQNN